MMYKAENTCTSCKCLMCGRNSLKHRDCMNCIKCYGFANYINKYSKECTYDTNKKGTLKETGEQSC